MRELTDREINILEEQGCWAESWQDIIVDDDFMTDAVRNVTFYGHVEIGRLNGTLDVEEGFRRRCCLRNATLRNVVVGDECLIENVSGYINGYSIGNQCYISNVGTMTCQEGASFASGTLISVLNEGGEGNVVLNEHLTAQAAWLMVNGIGRTLKDAEEPAPEDVYDDDERASLAVMGAMSRIIDVKEISNVKIDEYCEIHGASRLDNCTVLSTEDANTFIGCDVIMENTIVAAGASVTDGAKVMECFVGESVHIGKGFSAENSLFFANSYMDNGEACAVLCGPFSTSHHKSTLLIGCAFSFYTAGSATNQSNHAYKMGPIHWGMLDRGAKTASGSHLLLPVHLGVFSVAIGKIQTHPQTFKMPFSYVIGDGDRTWLVPGVNIRTVGTWRDVKKWPTRDLRPLSSRSDIVNYAFPNPYIVQYVVEGREALLSLLKDDREEYEYGGCVIRHDAAVKGVEYYDTVLRLFLREALKHGDGGEAAQAQWFDMCGMIVTKEGLDAVVHDVKSGAVSSLVELQSLLRQIDADYQRCCEAYALWVLQSLGDALFNDAANWREEADEAYARWLQMVKDDAEKEFRMGDVEQSQLRKFIKEIDASC
ncbi:MAG: DUF4954 family protein [Bacteroidaceae bacterium]|nr:DUF4954 family protein [Bacteroidaceae bacterium]